MTLLRSLALLLAASLVVSAADVPKKERWLYLSTNLQVKERADDAVALLERAKKSGYTHLLLADSKFAHLGQVSSEYVPNAMRVRAAGEKLGIEIVPSVFPVGYSNDALFHDPNLAEGLPVRDVPFVVKSGIATIMPAEKPLLPKPDARKEWDFVDESVTGDGAAMKSGPTDGNARLFKKVAVAPFRQYHLSAKIRTQDFGKAIAELKAIGAGDRSLQWTSIKVAPTQEATTYDVTFNSLDSTTVSIYLGIWGGHQGTLWWEDARLEECGPVNILRRPGAPLKITRQNGKLLEEGKDFEKLADPHLGNDPWAGAYKAWHEPPVIRTKGIPDGEVLKVSYYHPHIIGDEQVCGCVEEPSFQAILKDQAIHVADLWHSHTHLMAHDEWRVLGWDESCQRSGKKPAAIVAGNARFCTSLLEQKVPGGRTLIWSDMFDPFHNAVDHYYLVNGTLEGSWEGLSPKTDIMNWNFGKRAESLKFFASRGHAQVIAGFYDEDISHVNDWIASAKDVPKVKGFMYTTWSGDYSKLEEVAKILDAAGW